MNAGTLRASTSTPLSATLNNGDALKGTGTIAGLVTCNAGGRLAPNGSLARGRRSSGPTDAGRADGTKGGTGSATAVAGAA